MTPELLAALRKEIEPHEGNRTLVYDDVTGLHLTKGVALHGYATIGIGRNLMTRGLLPNEVDLLFANDMAQAYTDLFQHLPWFDSAPVPVQVCVIELYFNTTEGNSDHFVKEWPHFLGQLEAKQYTDAADNLQHSQPWSVQVGPERAKTMSDLLRSVV